MPDTRTQNARSVDAYARRASTYDAVHSEIFNTVEQRRLGECLERAISEVRSGGLQALDYGCGTGNLTRHLLALGAEVTAADISPKFLEIVAERYRVRTIRLEDGEPTSLPAAGFDFIGLYSVLHHIPDYLKAVRDLVGKLRPGGVIFLDHEWNDERWNASPALVAFNEEIARVPSVRWWDPDKKRWQHLLRAAVTPSRHMFRFRRLLDPRYSDEGDIHTWPDDHIEWDQVAAAAIAGGAEVVHREDYLSFQAGYDEEVWARYRDRCSDMTALIARRRESA
jgi:2-polyprenyl-3-methyl-5-hydroxy-6-metoxy-1,4-benzoquinol methylase